MSARKIRNTWWVDFRAQGIRYRVKSPADSRTGAQSYEAVLRQRLAKGEPLTPSPAPPPPPTYREFAENWLATYVKTNNKASEQDAKRTTLARHLIPFFGHERIDTISSRRVEEYKAAKTKEGLSPKTVNNHLAILGKSLHHACDWALLKNCPQIGFLKVPPSKFDFLLPDECERLLAAIEEPLWHAMVLVALKTGMRCGELLGLEWDDVDMARGQVAVRHSVVRGVVGSPKNNRIRFIPMTGTVYDELFRLKRKAKLVFCKDDGTPLYHDTPIRALHRFCAQAKLRPVGWHTLRHTFASHLVGRGVSIRAVQELLGHSTITMTMRYSHLAPTALREAVDVLDAPLEMKIGQPVGNTREVTFHPSTKKALSLGLIRSLVPGGEDGI